VVRVAGWHAGDPGSILGRDDLYTFGDMPQRFQVCFGVDFCYLLILSRVEKGGNKTKLETIALYIPSLSGTACNPP
jgi:hypothetical protein